MRFDHRQRPVSVHPDQVGWRSRSHRSGTRHRAWRQPAPVPVSTRWPARRHYRKPTSASAHRTPHRLPPPGRVRPPLHAMQATGRICDRAWPRGDRFVWAPAPRPARAPRTAAILPARSPPTAHVPTPPPRRARPPLRPARAPTPAGVPSQFAQNYYGREHRRLRPRGVPRASRKTTHVHEPVTASRCAGCERQSRHDRLSPEGAAQPRWAEASPGSAGLRRRLVHRPTHPCTDVHESTRPTTPSACPPTRSTWTAHPFAGPDHSHARTLI